MALQDGEEINSPQTLDPFTMAMTLSGNREVMNMEAL